VNGEANRVHNKAFAFLAKLKSARGAMKELVASFAAWYGLAATELITDNGIKLTAANIKALGESEFSRLMGGMVTEVDSLITAVGIQEEQAKEHKKTQAEKFKLGEKQVQNSYMVNHMPTYRTEVFSDAPDLTRKSAWEPQDEDVPAFVSQKPQFAEPAPAHSPHIVGTFVKTLPPAVLNTISVPIRADVVVEKPLFVSKTLENLAHEPILTPLVPIEREQIILPAPLEIALPLEKMLELLGGEVAPPSKLDIIPARKPLILDPDEEDFL
jgi:hypothetical protein